MDIPIDPALQPDPKLLRYRDVDATESEGSRLFSHAQAYPKDAGGNRSTGRSGLLVSSNYLYFCEFHIITHVHVILCITSLNT